MSWMKKYFINFSSLFIILIIVLYSSLALHIAKSANDDTKIRSDAILVLGARSYRANSYNPCLVSRVKQAANLYKAGYARKIIVSGGNDKEDNVNEAETMKKIAGEYGVPGKDIILERQATSTYENFLFSQKILQANNLTSIIIVTEPFHIARSELVARKLNFDYSVSPAIDSPCWLPWRYVSKYFVKEPFAIFMYKLQDKL